VFTLDPVTSELLYRNADAVQANGFELEVERMFAGGRRVRVSSAFQDVTDKKTGDHAVNSPYNVTQALAETPAFTPRVLAGIELIYVGDRDTLAGDTANGYVLTNLTLRAPQVLPGVELAVIARNIFDEAYSDPVGPELVQDSLQQDGFSLAVRLTVRH